MTHQKNKSASSRHPASCDPNAPPDLSSLPSSEFDHILEDENLKPPEDVPDDAYDDDWPDEALFMSEAFRMEDYEEEEYVEEGGYLHQRELFFLTLPRVVPRASSTKLGN
jgi:hypothetical protein